MNHFKMAKANPFRFVKSTPTPGMHFDDALSCERVPFYQMKRVYNQKWQNKDETFLQCESSIAPQPLRLVDRYNQTVKSFEWSVVVPGVGYSIYECFFSVQDVPRGTYFLIARAAFLAIDWVYISEPIDLAEKHRNTILIKYYNSFNSIGIAWRTGVKFHFRVEASIPDNDYEPLNDVNTYQNQLNDTTVLSAAPGDSFIMRGGDTTAMSSGVAPWVLRTLNYIFSCDNVYISNEIDLPFKGYTLKPGQKIKKNGARGYPLVGFEAEIVPTTNEDSMTFQDDNPLSPEIVTGYNIKTAFFGAGGLVPIIQITRNV